MGFSVSEAQLQRMVDLAQPSSERPTPGECFDHGLLSRLQVAFDCVDVTFQVSDPGRRRLQNLTEATADGVSVTTDNFFADDDERSAYWGAHFADLSCCYPETTGDHVSVTNARDFYDTDHAFANSASDRVFEPMESLMVPLPWSEQYDRRLLFWRYAGHRYSESDRLLLTLLRPHLERVLESHDLAARGFPALTPREREAVTLLAQGMTNRQIGRKLGIAEGTVRKHLEHVYARLGVTNRVAVLAAFPELLTEPHSGASQEPVAV